MHAHAAIQTKPESVQENLIAVWPDESWCAYKDIQRMSHEGDDYQLLRVTRWGKDGQPASYEFVKR